MNGEEEDASGQAGGAGERHRAREAALQMLYQWEVGRSEIGSVLTSYWTMDRPGEMALAPRLQEFANQLASGTVQHVSEIDPVIGEHAEHWRLSRMAIIDRLILRMAVFEFLHAPDVPRKVVINEALELAKTFSADDAVKFVNGILDGIRRRLEESEPREM